MHPEFLSEKLKEFHQQQQKEDSKSSWFQSAWSVLKSRLGKLKNYVIGDSVTPAHVPCINIYLGFYFELLSGEKFHPNMNPLTVANTIVAIYGTLYKPYFSCDGNSRIVVVDGIKL